ncbi:kinase-like domain-containing protein [Glomus cerebriforme]|uniref:Kinase-like domain-containing protein n=1 Tax=Glomus cerebriforme TaxID=658196 RepID=A0A397T2M4_9GLOM|nr:kinase-like domain-containing protein [Glomus cerebriforme]
MSSNFDMIIIQIKDQPLRILVRLKLNDNLSIIRKELEMNNFIDDTLLFSKKYSQSNNNNESYELINIVHENEENILLIDIVEKFDTYYILYLVNSIESNWRFLIDKLKLEYGRIITPDGIRVANKKAFIIKDCEMTEIGSEGFQNGLDSNEDGIMETELFFTEDIHFSNFGLSIRSKNNNSIDHPSYYSTETSKISLNFNKYLELTPEFIYMVKDAIKSKHSKKEFEKINEEFGQIISDEVILGGRSDFPSITENKSCKLIEGQNPDNFEDVDEKLWVTSLKGFKNLDCIKFKNPVNIFQFLPSDLCKDCFISISNPSKFIPINNSLTNTTFTDNYNDNSVTFIKNNNLGPSELVNFIVVNRFVKFINMNELSAITDIDGGHFGTISKAIWKTTNDFVICKRLKNIQSICYKQKEAFLHELSMHKRLDYCSRIIRILGISFDEYKQEYLLMMEYADGGDLRKYLQEKFTTLTWDDKFKLAYQITEGIKYLHGENIIHRDLHSKNIVIHRGEAKIIDLGIAKSIETETNLHLGIFGMIAYIDPKILADPSYNYKHDKRSDVYSLGVLMWELSSGYPPFIIENNNTLGIQLINGRREEPIPNTPKEYLELYKLCWSGEPDLRPTINEVFIKLGKMLGIQDVSNYNDDDIQDFKSEQHDDNQSFVNNDTGEMGQDSKMNELSLDPT